MKEILILFIIALFAGFIYLLTRKLTQNKFIPFLLLFGFGIAFAYLIPLSLYTQELIDTALKNLTPSMVFLYALDFDYKKLLKNEIGCSCKMGAKRYWILVISSFVVAFAVELLSYRLFGYNNFFFTILVSFIIGLVAQKTRLQTINGSEDIATTMLYLLAILIGMKLVLIV